MKYFITLFAILAFGANAFAQVPGYMGKKHQFTYTPAISMYGDNYRSHTNALGLFYLNHRIEYDYVIKKNRTIGLLYEYCGVNIIPYYINNNIPLHGRYTRHQVGFTSRKYKRKNNLAPLGFYWKYTLSIAYSQSTIDKESITKDYPLDKPIKYSMVQPIIGVGIGREFVIGKFVPLNLGFDIQVPLISMVSASGFLDKPTQQMNLASTLFRFNIGIGILAF